MLAETLSPEQIRERTERINRVVKMIESSGSHIFKATFIKADGSYREMVCRRHVSKGVTGALAPGKRIAEDKANDCLTVYDMQADGFRRIPLDRLLSLKCEGQEYSFA